MGESDVLPEIWSYGHRNPQGLAIHPETGDVWITEHGPQGGDELNRILPRLNYVLPEIWSYGHRKPQGLAIHPETGDVWITEHRSPDAFGCHRSPPPA